MAVELARSPQVVYKPVSRQTGRVSTRRANLRLVSLKNLDKSRTVTQDNAFRAAMERALLNQKYWDELLEKLRKSGGGGGGNKRFDKIAVSMMLTNFLNNKTILAMMRNFSFALLKLENNIGRLGTSTNQSLVSSFLSKFTQQAKSVFMNLSMPLRVLNRTVLQTVTHLSTSLLTFAGALSAQINKLKETLMEELNELLKKLDVKGKTKKLQAMLSDFFVELKGYVKNILQIFSTLKQNWNATNNAHKCHEVN